MKETRTNIVVTSGLALMSALVVSCNLVIDSEYEYENVSDIDGGPRGEGGVGGTVGTGEGGINAGDAGGLDGGTDGGTCDGDGACVDCVDSLDCASALHASVNCVSNSCVIAACTFEYYDVDGLYDSGCEREDSHIGNHSADNATHLGSFSCLDTSFENFSGDIPSDTRNHSFAGFDSTTGSAPDYFALYAEGALCVNDISLTLSVNARSNEDCYALTVITSAGTYSCSTNMAGSCTISRGAGSYDDNTDISIIVAKTCDTAVFDWASYTVSGHL